MGAPGAPRWIEEALRGEPEGSTLEAAWLLPAPSVVRGPLCAPVDRVLGRRVMRLPDGTRRCEDLSGRTVVVPADRGGDPEHALVFPGTDRLVTVCQWWEGTVRLHDPDGALLAETGTGYRAGPFNAGTALLPHLRYWRHLQPRDPQESAALRRLDEATAAALLTGAMAALEDEKADDQGGLPALVGTLLPEVGHQALRTGITGVVRFAAEQQRVLDAPRTRLDAAIAGGARRESRPEPGDELLEAAVNGVGLTGRSSLSLYTSYYSSGHDLYGLPRLLGRSMRSPAEPAPPAPAHVELVRQNPLRKLDALALPELPTILALRAGSECTVEEHREALDAFLEVFDTQGLTELDPGHWRSVRLRLDRSLLVGPDALSGAREEAVLDLAGGAFLLFPSRPYHFLIEWDSGEDPGGVRFGALFHDPSGRFEVPEPYTLIASGPFVPEPTRSPGWVAAFRAELAERGPATWFPSAAEEFARRTGVTPTMAGARSSGRGPERSTDV
ncbi:hypothetical protein [Streptomyces sp. NPDC056600]|uniref:hypothetical protein n=1 Tax=Streptomyces sp. NPDC056600 TaxID=3345874 RepID=UPI0036BB1939